MSQHEDIGPYEKITRLTDMPVVNGMHTYRCNACGETDKGNDRVAAHVKWRKKHWAECWGMPAST